MTTSATIGLPPGEDYSNGGTLTSFPCSLRSNQSCAYCETPLMMTSIILFGVILLASSYSMNQHSLPSQMLLTKALEASWIILTACGIYPVMIFINSVGYSMVMKGNYGNPFVIMNSLDTHSKKKASTSIS